MPKLYSTEEKEDIVRRLKQETRECLSLYGIKKTTVDELVKRVHIPKGTFYLFYKSKELLIFDVFLEIHEEFEKKIQLEFSQLDLTKIDIDQVTKMITYFFKAAKDNPVFKILSSSEMEDFTKKLPLEVIQEHFQQDDDMLENFIKFIPHRDQIDISQHSAALRNLFMLMFTEYFEKEEDFKSIELLVKGIVIQIME